MPGHVRFVVLAKAVAWLAWLVYLALDWEQPRWLRFSRLSSGVHPDR